MIHPNMATMLGFLTTDAAITTPMLQKALKLAVDDTFNMVSVDGDTSTNDMVSIMANGMAENPVIDKEGADFDLFVAVVKEICTSMAKKIAGDGEGATKLVECTVTGRTDHSSGKSDCEIRDYLQPDKGGNVRRGCQLGAYSLCDWVYRG